MVERLPQVTGFQPHSNKAGAVSAGLSPTVGVAKQEPRDRGHPDGSFGLFVNERLPVLIDSAEATFDCQYSQI